MRLPRQSELRWTGETEVGGDERQGGHRRGDEEHGLNAADDVSGVAPVVVCRNSGTKTVIANSEAVARKRETLTSATVLVRSRCRGTIGSRALLGLHRALIDQCASWPSPAPPAGRIRRDVRAEADRAIAQLEHGLGDFGVREG